MAQLLVVILHDASQLPAILDAWYQIDVPGVTILESAGGHRARNWLHQMGLGALGGLFGAEDVRSKTLLTLIEDKDMLEKAIVEAERVIGDFYRPSSGLLFVLPTTYSLGILRPEAEEEKAVPPAAAKRLEAMIDTERITRDTFVSVIDQILSLAPVIVQTDQLLIDVAEAIASAPSNVHVACVVNQQQRLVGLLPLRTLADDLFMLVSPEDFLSEAYDLEHVMQYAKLSGTRTAGDAMIPAVWVKPDDTFKNTFRKMHENQLSGIPIVNDHYQVTGYVDLLELFNIYIRDRKSSENQGA